MKGELPDEPRRWLTQWERVPRNIKKERKKKRTNERKKDILMSSKAKWVIGWEKIQKPYTRRLLEHIDGK